MDSNTKSFKYYDVIMVTFVTCLLCSNLIGATKVCTVFGVTFGGSLLFFPISYLFGDILTEVYGYKRSRKVVWAGFAALGFATLMSLIVLHMPPDPSWSTGLRIAGTSATLDRDGPVRLSNQAIWETVFGGTWRVV